ncbi:hypothetical protein SY83_20740 [Paenibacillus swuensis]|uniref:Phosphodiester glycosidase domain-containing protein n=2 Tax=Paenibacillus swuensis TaxID=1178515 RepID=A0A172TQP5_9BACL|nr:hypothetical protein SY83_20740 [Paenibacillus swuensis]
MPARSGLRSRAPVIAGFMLAAACLAAALWASPALRESGKPLWSDAPAGYTYRQAKSKNGVVLHIMQTTPENIRLEAVSANVTKTKRYGINGGFFYEGDLLSIAVQNDRAARGGGRVFGSGWHNVKYSRGTLVWDGAAQAFSVQVAASADALAVKDRGRYWAQGGISMNLRDHTRWAEQAGKEAMPFPNERRMRSGLVYDNVNRLYLIVSPTLTTAAAFRSAILETLNGQGRDTRIEGVFLDGDGSSQMQCTEIQLSGDQREVYQMLTLIQSSRRE